MKPLRGITYLQEHELLSSPLDPKEVVRFIKENPKLDKKQIGDFISNKKYSAVLEEYQKCVIICLNTCLLPTAIFVCDEYLVFKLFCTCGEHGDIEYFVLFVNSLCLYLI